MGDCDRTRRGCPRTWGAPRGGGCRAACGDIARQSNASEAGSGGGNVRAHPQEGGRPDRLDLARVENLQSIAWLPSVARRLQLLSRSDFSPLEIARCERRPIGRAGADDRAKEAPFHRVWRSYGARAQRGSSGRPQTHVGRSLLERPAPERQRKTRSEDRLKLPLGYRYSAVYAGIRKVQKDDLALIA